MLACEEPCETCRSLSHCLTCHWDYLRLVDTFDPTSCRNPCPREGYYADPPAKLCRRREPSVI